MRPKSIWMFERLYLLAIIVGVVANALAWRSALARLAQAGDGSPIGPQGLLAIAIGSLVADIALWYFAAYRASRVAKWILTAWIALGVFGLLLGIVRHAFIGGLIGMLTLIAVVLKLAGVAQMFQPDARAWFAGADAA